MSVTESKAVSKASKSTRSPKKAAVTGAVEQALANAPVEMVPVSQLVHIGQNVRKHKPDPEKLQELAASILSVGVLQNLVVCQMPDGMLGVAAGGRRLSALHLLLEAGSLTADYPVPVKIVELGMAMYVSETENSKRENMHPADQIAAFAKMSETGDTAAQIGSVLGYTTKHVQKCLRLGGWLQHCLLNWLKTVSTLISCRRCLPPKIMNASWTSGKMLTVFTARRGSCATLR